MGLLKSLTEYEPYTWETGDVITAELLNHMEEGIAAASQGGDSDSITVNKPVLYIQSNGDTTYTVNGWTADATET